MAHGKRNCPICKADFDVRGWLSHVRTHEEKPVTETELDRMHLNGNLRQLVASYHEIYREGVKDGFELATLKAA